MAQKQRGPGSSLKSTEPGSKIALPADPSNPANTPSDQGAQGDVDLADLARRIDGAHHHVKSELTSALEHAIEAGRLLLKAKEALPHGDWLPWLAKSCAVSECTAQNYM